MLEVDSSAQSYKRTLLVKIRLCRGFNSFSFRLLPSEHLGSFPWVPFHSVSYTEFFTCWEQAFLFVSKGGPIPLGQFPFFSDHLSGLRLLCPSQRHPPWFLVCWGFFILIPPVSQGCFCEQRIIPDLGAHAPAHVGMSFLLGWETMAGHCRVVWCPLPWGTCSPPCCPPLPLFDASAMPDGLGEPSGELLLAFGMPELCCDLFSYIVRSRTLASETLQNVSRKCILFFRSMIPSFFPISFACKDLFPQTPLYRIF